ncbi:P-loop containing nucleoside triphosphate hydrolase protein [Vararia minispora EC-137]|uniref:P-loop containing nucleoside triphosphate hydrolase protein n=1 Tax=Vararia minispora EC-137 TaxID=1314806 RepID=A0ACB8QNK0_9AGAM|nr:P-loop containing nucleoside triphosphate hydrolase protein [Vararia minispora EC-137]
MSTTPPTPAPIPLARPDGSLPPDDEALAARTHVVLVGVGGATCSGKTTLAKHLRDILPDSFIIHQDDFAPPQATLPIHPALGVEDWDSAPTALDWPRLRAYLRTVKTSARIPHDHSSHDHLNVQVPVPVESAIKERWRTRFQEVQKDTERAHGVRVVWALVDGFLLYWDKAVVDLLDAMLFLRVPHDTLRQRREERSGYATAEGTFWRDPPGYWDQLVYPAYVDAHRALFEDGNIETGVPTLPGLKLFEPLRMRMDDVVERSCEVIERALRASFSGEV